MSELERRRSGRDAQRDLTARPAQPGKHEEPIRRYLGGLALTEEAQRREEERLRKEEARRRDEAAGREEAQRAAAAEVRAAAELRQRPSIVVGVDDSPASFTAAEQAAVEADLRGWPVHLVHVRHRDGAERGTALLDEMAARIRARTAAAVTTELCSGPVAHVLLDRATDAGLLVVGSRGRGPLAGMVAGSISAELATRATAPVLVTRIPPAAAARVAGRPPAPAAGTPVAGERVAGEPVAEAEFPALAGPPGIVVGVDGSPAADAAAAFAAEEARLRGVALIAVAVTASAPDYLAESGPDPLATGALDPAGAAVAGIPVRRVAVDGDAADALVEASAHALGIVVGAHGRRGPHGVRLGSTSQAVIRRAHCPVYVVHPVATSP